MYVLEFKEIFLTQVHDLLKKQEENTRTHWVQADAAKASNMKQSETMRSVLYYCNYDVNSGWMKFAYDWKSMYFYASKSKMHYWLSFVPLTNLKWQSKRIHFLFQTCIRGFFGESICTWTCSCYLIYRCQEES